MRLVRWWIFRGKWQRKQVKLYPQESSALRCFKSPRPTIIIIIRWDSWGALTAVNLSTDLVGPNHEESIITDTMWMWTAWWCFATSLPCRRAPARQFRDPLASSFNDRFRSQHVVGRVPRGSPVWVHHPSRHPNCRPSDQDDCSLITYTSLRRSRPLDHCRRKAARPRGNAEREPHCFDGTIGLQIFGGVPSRRGRERVMQLISSRQDRIFLNHHSWLSGDATTPTVRGWVIHPALAGRLDGGQC